MKRNLVVEKGLLAEVPLTHRQLIDLRGKRLIPFFKISHKVILYDVDRVLEALEKLEISEVTK